MTEPIIAKITDGECGMVELLQEAQLLINQRDAYKKALEMCCVALSQANIYNIPSNEQFKSDYWYQKAQEEK